MAARADRSRAGESTRNKSSMSQSRTRNISESTKITLGQRSRRKDPPNTTQNGASFNTRSYANMDETQRSSHSTRTADLSYRVLGLEKGLTSVNGKLDQLIALQLPHSNTSTPRPPRERSPRPATRYLDFENELKKGEPDFTTHRGKDMVKDFYVDHPIPRPYMFLDIPGLHTQKEKATYRDKMTFNEYVLAFTTMLRDRRACSPEDWPHLVEHLNQVACDATSRPWPDVRNWSDSVFGRIEKGDITWDNTAEIQYDRMRMSIAPSAAKNQAPSQDPQPQSQRSVTCADFSARRCRHKASHTEAGITYMHNCAWCFAALNLRNTTHNVIDCDNKFGRQLDRQPRAQPQQQNIPQQRQHTPFFTYQQQQSTQPQPRRQVVTSAVIQNTNQPPRPKNDQ